MLKGNKCNVVWFRNDLRTLDHHALTGACAGSMPVIALAAWEPVWDGPAEADQSFDKTGVHRRRFWKQSIEDLRRQLAALNIPLIVSETGSVQVMNQLIDSFQVEHVYAYRYPGGTEEALLEKQMQQLLSGRGIRIHWSEGHTLIPADQLPGGVRQLPDVFTKFRIMVEKEWTVPTELPVPERRNDEAQMVLLNACREKWVADIMPEISLGDSSEQSDSTFIFTGGQTAGMARLFEFLDGTDAICTYKETRNGLRERNDSSKLSPWLAQGCLSARTVYWAVRSYESRKVKNESTYWLLFELLWRDYFQFLLMKHGAKLFRLRGVNGLRLPWTRDAARLSAWMEGRTGYPLVDAAMRELKATGFISNRARQIVACFLTKYLNVDWRIGAAWFESQLIDYDPASNYGNWTYVAGVGNDPRGFRVFAVRKQAEQYDPLGLYVRQWVPELAGLPAGMIHQPEKMGRQEQELFGVWIGKTYPSPVVDGWTELTVQEQAYTEAAAVRKGHARGHLNEHKKGLSNGHSKGHPKGSVHSYGERRADRQSNGTKPRTGMNTIELSEEPDGSFRDRRRS